MCHCEETGESRQNQQIIDALVQLVKCEPSALHEKVLSNMRLCIHNLKSGDILENWGSPNLDYCYEPSQLPAVFRDILKKLEHIKFMDCWAIELVIAYDNEHASYDDAGNEEKRNSRTRKLLTDFHKLVEDRDFSVMPP